VAEPYAVHYTEEAVADFDRIRKFDRTRIVHAILRHLAHEPRRESRSRIKRMVLPFWSQYRLRVDEFRVYYDVDDVTRRVNVLRIIEKGTDITPQESP
jgi:mRNA-degrading endonuclease RelE of RelBE toxin-antitoxin system